MPYYVCDIRHRCGHTSTHTLPLMGEGEGILSVRARKKELARKRCDLCLTTQPRLRRSARL